VKAALPPACVCVCVWVCRYVFLWPHLKSWRPSLVVGAEPPAALCLSHLLSLCRQQTHPERPHPEFKKNTRPQTPQPARCSHSLPAQSPDELCKIHPALRAAYRVLSLSTRLNTEAARPNSFPPTSAPRVSHRLSASAPSSPSPIVPVLWSESSLRKRSGRKAKLPGKIRDLKPKHRSASLSVSGRDLFHQYTAATASNTQTHSHSQTNTPTSGYLRGERVCVEVAGGLSSKYGFRA
jgi:hypothetical protein